MFWHGATFRSILREELERRCNRNPRYSLRAFAKTLGMSSARLSEVMNGKTGLSRVAAETIALRLGFRDDEREYFADLVESEHARSQVKRELAKQRLQRFKVPEYQQLQMDSFRLVSEWYYFALLELLQLPSAQSDTAWIARSLGITQAEAKLALERLERIGLIRWENQRAVPVEDWTFSPAGVPSEAIRSSHKQILEKATTAVDAQSIDERDLSAMILSVSSADMPEAKKMIQEFRRAFAQRFGKPLGRDEVYCLSVQYFKLSQIEKSEE